MHVCPETIGVSGSRGGGWRSATSTGEVQAIQGWPTLRSPRALWGFLGLARFYRRFIKGYATLAAPLTKLLCHTQFQWSTTTNEAFQKLKETIMAAPVLALPNFKSPFVVETYASGSGMGAVLMQEGHPSPSSVSNSARNWWMRQHMSVSSQL